MSAFLRPITGGPAFALTKSVILIGRNPDVCDICLKDPSVSLSHCLIEQAHGKFRIQDLGSRNGTLINGHRVLRAALWHGDELTVGVHKFVLDTQESSESPSDRLQRTTHDASVPSSRRMGVTKTPQGQRSSPSQSPKPDRARARMPRASIESDCGSGPRFIYWADGQQSSPVFLSELRQRIATGHLTRNEFIKPEGDSQWIPAHTVPGLFFADASASSIDLNDAAEIDTTSFERPTVVDPPQPGSVVALPSSPVNAQKNCDKVDDDLAFQSLAPAIQHDNVVRIVKHTSRLDRSGPASWRSRPSLEQETENRLANRIRQRLQFTRQRLFGAFAILLILASMISCYFWATRGKEQVIFDRYASIWEELKAQRTKAIGPDKWSEFQNRVQLENEHFVQILEVRIGAIGNSKARRDAALKLLTIGRDYLPKMLTDARLKPIREEVEFAKQMKQVHEILNGK